MFGPDRAFTTEGLTGKVPSPATNRIHFIQPSYREHGTPVRAISDPSIWIGAVEPASDSHNRGLESGGVLAANYNYTSGGL